LTHLTRRRILKGPFPAFCPPPMYVPIVLLLGAPSHRYAPPLRVFWLFHLFLVDLNDCDQSERRVPDPLSFCFVKESPPVSFPPLSSSSMEFFKTRSAPDFSPTTSSRLRPDYIGCPSPPSHFPHSSGAPRFFNARGER